MAQKIQTTLIDDLDLDGEATGTVMFALDGATYEIDLDDQYTAELRATLAPYVAQVASLVGRGTLEPPTASSAAAPAASADNGPVSAVRP